jgi:adenylate cyclase
MLAMSEPSERTKVPRRLAAILAADIAGYRALMGADEARTVRDLKDHLAVVLPMVSAHGGRVIYTAGDGILAEFGSVVNAVECAVAVQKAMTTRNAQVQDDLRHEYGNVSLPRFELANGRSNLRGRKDRRRHLIE